MLEGLKNLLASEKAIASGIVSITSTVLVALGRMTIDQWIDFNEWVLTVYVAGKTLTTGVTALANKSTTKTEAKVDVKVEETKVEAKTDGGAS